MVKDLIKKYINQSNIMQLATSRDNKPWVVTVHFFADEELNVFWSSRPDRRHSKDIESNHNASATMLIHENTVEEDWVIGLTISGTSEIYENMDEATASKYVNKLHKDPQLAQKIADGTDPAKWYRLKPTELILFDNKDFPNEPRQSLTL